MTLGTITVAGLIAAAVLVWLLFRRLAQDQLDAILEKRKGSSRLVTRANYVEGLESMPVVLSLGNDAIYYQNADLDASFDLNRIDEVEYSDELATGRSLHAGYKALRLRSHGTAFEFEMPAAEMAKWHQALPPRRMNEPAAARVGPAARVG